MDILYVDIIPASTLQHRDDYWMWSYRLCLRFSSDFEAPASKSKETLKKHVSLPITQYYSDYLRMIVSDKLVKLCFCVLCN